jgi:hypothetical protein
LRRNNFYGDNGCKKGRMSTLYFRLKTVSNFLVTWSEVRLSPLDTSATVWSIAATPDDRVWSSRWNENWQRKRKYSEKTCPGTTSSTTNPTWPDLGLDPGCRGGKPATDRLSYVHKSGYGNLFCSWTWSRRNMLYVVNKVAIEFSFKVASLDKRPW